VADFSAGDVVVFHKACVDKWFAVSVQRPVCKRALDGLGADQASADCQRSSSGSD
jgi:hypothetical protein